MPRAASEPYPPNAATGAGADRIANAQPRSPAALGVAAACWAAAGVLALLGYAVFRLVLVIAEGLTVPWDWRHWTVGAANALFMAWSEGYRGFQLQFSPRTAARIKWLSRNPYPAAVALAPLLALGYFNATRRRLVSAYGLTGFVVAAIIVVHLLPQPWRAVLDIGVVIGLAWGMASLAWFLGRAFAEAEFPASPELARPDG